MLHNELNPAACMYGFARIPGFFAGASDPGQRRCSVLRGAKRFHRGNAPHATMRNGVASHAHERVVGCGSRCRTAATRSTNAWTRPGRSRRKAAAAEDRPDERGTGGSATPTALAGARPDPDRLTQARVTCSKPAATASLAIGSGDKSARRRPSCEAASPRARRPASARCGQSSIDRVRAAAPRRPPAPGRDRHAGRRCARCPRTAAPSPR
jgi:hypothetical protein